MGAVIGVTQISNAQDQAPPPANNGLEVLGRDCEGSELAAHTGFQDGNRCVSTQMGEVSGAAQNPSLLIAEAPEEVRVNTAFRLEISTRNLVRDRFLGAAAGGYYLESSFLNAQGLQRGHFHVACRMLESTDAAPDPAPVPAFFRAIEDGRGSNEPDTVTVEVVGLPAVGTGQCTVWAGDGSHRAPMMQRANQTPAMDSIRIQVVPAGDDDVPPPDDDDNEAPPADDDNEAPPADDDNEAPPADDDNEAPPADDDNEAPPADDDNEAPPADDDNEAPPADDDNEAPPADDDNEAPPADDDNEAPPADDDNEAPPADDDNEAPPADNANDTPPATDPAVQPAAQQPQNDNLALTGTKTFTYIAAGLAMMFTGLVILSSTRKRREGASWR